MPEPLEASELNFPEGSELAALMRLRPAVSGEWFRDGEYLIEADDTGRDIFLVIEGSFVVEHHEPGLNAKGGTLSLRTATGNEPVFVGEMAYLGEEDVRTAAVRCAGAVKVLRLSPMHLERVLVQMPGLTRTLCRQFAQRVKESNRAIKAYQKLFKLDARHETIAPGHEVVQAGSPATTLVQLLDGSLTGEGDGVVLRQDRTGDVTDFVNASAFFSAGVNDLTWRAERPSIVLLVDARMRDAAVRAFPEVILEVLAERALRGVSP